MKKKKEKIKWKKMTIKIRNEDYSLYYPDLSEIVRNGSKYRKGMISR